MKFNSKNIGKRLEQDFEHSLTKYCYERLKDSPNKYKKVHNPADYIVFTGRTLMYIECKTTKENRFPLKNIQNAQLIKMLQKASKYNVIAGYLIEFRKYNKVYFITIGELVYFILNSKSQSIPYVWFEQNAYEVKRYLKRTRYKYDVDDLINYLEGELYVRE